MVTHDDYEVVSKNDQSGDNLTLVIKRKNLTDDRMMPQTLDDFCSLSIKKRFVEKLRAEESRFRNGSISSFYDRPSVSNETLIKMAFAELSEEERREGLQAHEIAQWLSRKFPYFSTLKSLLQCVTFRLITSKCFVKHDDGKKVLWTCSGLESDYLTAKGFSILHRSHFRRSRVRKRPNFYSVEWCAKDKKKRKVPQSFSSSQISIPLESPKREVTDMEDDENWNSQLNFLKNSQAIVQLCSPEKPPSIRKGFPRRRNENVQINDLFSYLGLMPVCSNHCDPEEQSEPQAKGRRSSLSCRSLFTEDENNRIGKECFSGSKQEPKSKPPTHCNVSSGNERLHSSMKKPAQSDYVLKTSKQFPSPVVPCNRSVDKSIPVSKHFNLSMVKTEKSSPLCKSQGCITSNAVRVGQTFQSSMKKSKKRIKSVKINKKLTNTSKTTNTPSRIPIVSSSSLFSNCYSPDCANSSYQKSKCKIIAGDNGSPMFPTIKSVFSMRRECTPQKLSSSYPVHGTPKVFASPWRRIYVSNNFSPQNMVMSRVPVPDQIPAFLSVPQVYGCFVAPPPTLRDSLQNDIACLDNFAQPTWTRDVKESIMSTTAPDRCYTYPLPMVQNK